ncbi:MAG: response regulator [bacterium]
MSKEKILVVEDEADILDLVAYHLEQAGYHVHKAEAGDKALDVVEQISPDLIILDLMLPGLSGTEVCKILKQEKNTRHIPIIMLTAKSEEIDRVVGFELGADDYVTKPFSPRELVLRAKAVLKRMHPSQDDEEVITVNNITIDVPKHLVLVDDKPVELTSTEFKLLLILFERQGRVQTRDILLESIWGSNYTGFSRTVDTHMRRLRSKLGAAGDCIETVRGVGYRLRKEEP